MNGKNVLLRIEYDGTDFHGWQKQPNERTVQGEIEHVLKYIAGYEVNINGTSRTDKGVHALDQCASFVWDCPIPTKKLAFVMNRRFGVSGTGRHGAPGDIRIKEAVEVSDDFHARFSCRKKTYEYIIDSGENIFERNYIFQYPKELDHDAMRKAAMHIIGTHDFKSFEASGGIPRDTTVRTVSALNIRAEGTRTFIEITGDGFLYNMVRIITGTLIEVGTGVRNAGDIKSMLISCSRTEAGFTAPPQGLYLKRIYFED